MLAAVDSHTSGSLDGRLRRTAEGAFGGTARNEQDVVVLEGKIGRLPFEDLVQRNGQFLDGAAGFLADDLRFVERGNTLGAVSQRNGLQHSEVLVVVHDE